MEYPINDAILITVNWQPYQMDGVSILLGIAYLQVSSLSCLWLTAISKNVTTSFLLSQFYLLRRWIHEDTFLVQTMWAYSARNAYLKQLPYDRYHSLYKMQCINWYIFLWQLFRKTNLALISTNVNSNVEGNAYGQCCRIWLENFQCHET